MAKHWQDRGGETGKMFEVKIMGKPTVNPEFFSAVKRLPHTRDPEVLLKNTLDLYGRYVLDDPESPPGSHLNDIREAVLEALALRPAEYRDLKAYSTVGIPNIDYKLGVDGYIEYADPKTRKTARVTLDATVNKRKIAEAEDMKADEIIGELPDAKQEEIAYLEAVERIGANIASMLIKRTAPPEDRRAA